MQFIKKVIFYLVLVVGTLLVVATMLSLIHDVRFWYIKALDFPRLQALLGLLVCLVLFIAVNRERSRSLGAVAFLAGLIANVALQAYFILPYTALADEAVASADPLAVVEDRSLSLLIANVWMKNSHAEDFLNIVYAADPDVVLAMETNEWWVERLSPLLERYPHKILYPLDNTYGMSLYSKLPLQKTEIKFLSHERVPSFHTRVKLPDGSSFMLHAVHPVPPKPSEYPDNIGEEEVALLKVGQMVVQEEEPTVVAGDFNDVAWSRTSRLFGTRSDLGDVRIGRGLYNSFDATSSMLRWPLDHVYVSSEFRVLALERLPKFGSDHFPIFIKLALDKGKTSN